MIDLCELMKSILATVYYLRVRVVVVVVVVVALRRRRKKHIILDRVGLCVCPCVCANAGTLAIKQYIKHFYATQYDFMISYVATDGPHAHTFAVRSFGLLCVHNIYNKYRLRSCERAHLLNIIICEFASSLRFAKNT